MKFNLLMVYLGVEAQQELIKNELYHKLETSPHSQNKWKDSSYFLE